MQNAGGNLELANDMALTDSCNGTQDADITWMMCAGLTLAKTGFFDSTETKDDYMINPPGSAELFA